MLVHSPSDISWSQAPSNQLERCPLTATECQSLRNSLEMLISNTFFSFLLDEFITIMFTYNTNTVYDLLQC